MVDVKVVYSELKKKYKDLPSFEELDSEFEVSVIDESFVLKAFSRKMIDKVEAYAKLVEDLLQPDSNLVSMYECRVFGDNEKEHIYDVFKKLLYFSRWAAEANLKADEKEDVKFICEFFKEWKELKPSLLGIVSKIKDSWKKETELKEDLEYFG